MTVTVRLFAMLRDQAGTGVIDVELGPDPTVGAVARRAASQAGIEQLMATLPVAMALNREYADADTPVVDGDELALIPPVSGGAPKLLAEITGEPISLDALVTFVRDPRAGAIVTFQGEPRDVDRLDYEAYVEMAEPRMAAILAAVAAAHGLVAIAAAHRTGPVPLGEASVAIAASAPHRPEAFAGAREAIDRIKAEVPIWKQEVSGEQSVWVVEDHAQ